MTAQRERRSTLGLIGNVFLYLSLLGFVGGFAVLGLSGFFDNDLLVYACHISLIIAVILPCYPFTTERSFEGFLSRGAGGLLLAATVAAIQFSFYPYMRLSTMLTVVAIGVVFLVGWIKTIPSQQRAGVGFGLLELAGAALTAFGAMAQPLLVRFGVASSEGLGLYGLPITAIGLLILFYARVLAKPKES